ncbi:phasin family protein [Alkalicoccus halolimnae]|uniref:Polyhydroxyalkanoate synthesis regulator n=1 Tax=Alkalicoccus halolimnae TaxID=1667239 RepID=A0A5C7F791_9BACI|nr:hypothetical protein [Alkalicoccus halolimnae]TXF86571.1 hypothetical protein FTX54_04915 [Alkalicoccus halolimnae]
MNNLFKSGILLGLGAAVSSKEKVEKYLDELISKGKVTPSEADDLYQTLIKKGEETEEEWNRHSKERLRTFFEDLNLVSKDEHEALKERTKELEERLKSLEANSRQSDL